MSLHSHRLYRTINRYKTSQSSFAITEKLAHEAMFQDLLPNQSLPAQEVDSHQTLTTSARPSISLFERRKQLFGMSIDVTETKLVMNKPIY